MTALVVGIGFSSGASALDIASLVTACLAGRTATSLGAPAFRAGLPAAHEAASLLSMRLVPVPDVAIRRVQDRCLTKPCRAALAVAEGAALVLAGEGGVLLGPRARSARVTCALAGAGG